MNFKRSLFWACVNIFYEALFLGIGVGGLFYINLASPWYSFKGPIGLLLASLLIIWVISAEVITRYYDPVLKRHVLENPVLNRMSFNLLLPVSNQTLAQLRVIRLMIYLIPILAPLRYKVNDTLVALCGRVDFSCKRNYWVVILSWMMAVNMGMFMVIGFFVLVRQILN